MTGSNIRDGTADFPNLAPCTGCGATERRVTEIYPDGWPLDSFIAVLRDIGDRAKGTLIEMYPPGYRVVMGHACACEPGQSKPML